MLDRLLPQVLAIGSDLDADETSPIISMSPNHKGTTEHFTSLDKIMGDGIRRYWISEGSERPHY